MPELDELGPGLRALADHAAGAARGLPPGTLRGRGDRRRRVRRGAVALAASTAVLLGVAVATTALPGGDDTGLPTTTTTTDGPPALPGSVLPPDTELAGFNEITGWAATAPSRGEDPADPTSVCQRDTLGSLGATEVRRRGYAMTVELEPGQVYEEPAEDLRATTRVAVAQFPDAATGRAAFDTVQDWVRSCAEHLAGTYRVADPAEKTPVYMSVDRPEGHGTSYLVTYRGSADEEAFLDGVWIDGTAVGVSADGTRVVLLSQRQVAQDYNYEDPAAAPVSLALEAVLARVAD